MIEILTRDSSYLFRLMSVLVVVHLLQTGSLKMTELLRSLIYSREAFEKSSKGDRWESGGGAPLEHLSARSPPAHMS